MVVAQGILEGRGAVLQRGVGRQASRERRLVGESPGLRVRVRRRLDCRLGGMVETDARQREEGRGHLHHGVTPRVARVGYVVQRQERRGDVTWKLGRGVTAGCCCCCLHCPHFLLRGSGEWERRAPALLLLTTRPPLIAVGCGLAVVLAGGEACGRGAPLRPRLGEVVAAVVVIPAVIIPRTLLAVRSCGRIIAMEVTALVFQNLLGKGKTVAAVFLLVASLLGWRVGAAADATRRRLHHNALRQQRKDQCRSISTVSLFQGSFVTVTPMSH